MRRPTRIATLLMTALLFTAIIPANSVATGSGDNSVYYGIEYDWKSLDNDFEGLTGLDINDMLKDVMDSATEAGFNLVIAEVTTGSSNMYVSSVEDHSSHSIQNSNGVSVDVWSRTTDLTIRHAVLIDTALLTDWDETKFGGTETSFDVHLSVDAESAITTDAILVEYFDSDYNLIGADFDLSFSYDAGLDVTIDVKLVGDGETLDIDFGADADVGFALDSSHLEWRLGEGTALYPTLASNNYVDFSCRDGNFGVEGDDGYADVLADCGEMDGNYASSADYSLNVDGIPTEEFGMDAGEFDLEISDSISDSGTFELDSDDLEYDGFNLRFGDSYAIETDAGETTNVRSCNDCGPVNPMMFFLMEKILKSAAEGLGEKFETSIENEELELPWEMAGSNADDDYEEEMFTCDNGNEIHEWEVNNGWDNCGDNSDEGIVIAHGQLGGYEGDINGNVQVYNAKESNDFLCADGDKTLPFYYVNDGYDDCGDNSDEAGTFYCDDGSSVSISDVNDGYYDCPDGEDEGVENYYLELELVLTNEGGTPLSSSVTEYCEDTSVCDEKLYSTTLYESIYHNGTHNSNVCLSWEVSDDVGILDSGNTCRKYGIQVSYLDTWDSDGLSLDFNTDISNTYDKDGYTVTLSLKDSTGSQVWSDSTPVDGGDSWMRLEDNIDVTAEGDYCLHVTIFDSSGGEVDTENRCEFVEDEPRPSAKLEKIGEAFADSGLESVMEAFGQNLEEKFSDIEEGEFPYMDGNGHFYWSDSHATIVGFGVYVEDNDENWHTWVGPTTAGFSDSPPVPISVAYLTGQAALDAMTDAEDDDTLEEIIDVTEHDVGEIEEVLEAAGVDPSVIDEITDNIDNASTDDTQTAEDLAEDGGWLPFISPITMVAITLLAGLVARPRSQLEGDE